jgi:hypothetical protein
VATLPVQPETGLVTALAPGASARLTVTFDVAATERAFELIARSRELAPGEEIVVPF